MERLAWHEHTKPRSSRFRGVALDQPFLSPAKHARTGDTHYSPRRYPFFAYRTGPARAAKVTRYFIGTLFQSKAAATCCSAKGQSCRFRL